VIQPSTITSTTTSFSTPTPTFEKAVGLEKFEGAKIQGDLTLSTQKALAGEDLKIQIHIANVGKEPVLLTTVDELFPEGFELVAKPDYCHREGPNLNLNKRRLDPIKTERLDLILRAFNAGQHQIQVHINCIDETGSAFSCTPDQAELQISESTLPDRITTGFRSLDMLLYGGIPENYAVVLTSPSCNEKDTLVQRFLECGLKEQHVTLLITSRTRGINDLLKACKDNLHVILCNPKASTTVDNQPNVLRVKGVENLTDISIAATSTFRKLDNSLKRPRRACIELISDVLLQHGAVRTRRWLNSLIPELRSGGFITLAVMNPYMHPKQEVQAILDLFDGEVTIIEKDQIDGKVLEIKKLYNKKYLEVELPIRR
jgi:hypothetical protein